MTPTEKLLAHLENILPRRDWEQQREAITRMVADVHDDGFNAAATGLEGQFNAMRTICDSYISEHPEDDNEPVTKEWLLSIGFEISRDGFPFHADMDGYLKPSPPHLFKDTTSAWDWNLEPPASNLLCVLFTRGDVRRLLTALGIEEAP